MTLIDLAQATAVQQVMHAPRFVSGGSVANTAVGLAELGGRAGFIGAVADDEVGQTYAENLRAAGVAFEPAVSGGTAADELRARAAAWCSSPTTPSGPWGRISERPRP